MNPSSLHALIVDQHLGELSPEAAELLDLHLARDPAAREEAHRIKQTLGVTAEAVLRHTELGRVMRETGTPRRLTWLPLAKAASIALLATLAAGAGFVAGTQQDHQTPLPISTLVSPAEPSPRKDSPWARYRIANERSNGNLQIVRVDAHSR